jgi:hypothetical protein
MKIDRHLSSRNLLAAAPAVAPPEHATNGIGKSATPPPPARRDGPPGSTRTFLLVGLPLLIAAILLLGALWPRAGLALDVGRPGDQLFLGTIHGDERVAEYTYRWTGKGGNPSTITVPGWGAVSRARVTVRAQTLPEIGGGELRLLVGEQAVGSVPIGAAMGETTAEIVLPAAASGGDLTLALAAPTSRVPGDNRDLGIKLDTITLTPLAHDSGAYWRTVWPHWLGALGLVGALLLLIGGHSGRLALAARYGAALIVPLALAVALPWGLALLPAALWAAAAALAVRWHRRLLDGLTTLWSALDRPRVAGWVAVGGIAFYVAVVLPHLLRVPWINHADYADNAVVARNLVQGRGFTVDYVAQFYRDWPTVRHAAETWPPLQPLMIAVSFLLFGVSTGTAKLPNLLVMVGLLWLVFQVGRSLWSPRVGLLAALFIAASPDLFDGVVYPLNDTAFALLSFGCLVLFGLLGEAAAKYEEEQTEPEQPSSRVARLRWPLLGLLGGLLLLCKPSGALLLAGGGAWALWRGWRAGNLRPVLLGGLVAAGVAALVWLPWGVRNMATFGVPFYSTESHDAWLLEYRDWETIYTVYAGRGDLPHPRLLVGYGFDAVSGKIVQQFRETWRDLREGEILPLLLLAPAILGAIVARGRQRALLAALGVSVALYTVFIATYWHYEQRYTLFLIPWGALLGAAGLWWLHDQLAAARSKAAAGLAVLAVLILILAPQWETLQGNWRADLRISNPLVVAWWVRDNTPADAIVMTRNPWELSFHSERQSVMIPFDNLATIKAIGAQYNVTYLQLDHLTERATRRPNLAPLYGGADEWEGFRKVFDRRDENGEGLLVYTFPQGGR